MPQKPALSFDDALAEVTGKPSGAKPTSFEEALADVSRADGTAKGGGFFGTLSRPDGRVSTELSIGVGFDGKETQIPLLVPSLSQREVDTLLSLKDSDPIPDAIADKAVKYAKLRMQAGKPVFAEPGEVGKFTPLPHEFKGERSRADNQVLGVPPELAALGAGAVGRAVITPGLNAVGRVVAGATAAATQAAPILKYEVAKQVLKHAGLPEPLPTIGGILAGGYKRGSAAREVAPVAETATVAETTPMGFPKPTEPAMTPLEFSRKLKAEHQAANIPPFSPPTQLKAQLQDFAKQASEAAGKTKLTASETALGFKLMKRGFSADDAIQLIKVRRALPEAWRKLPTDEEVEAIVKQANQSGRMTR